MRLLGVAGTKRAGKDSAGAFIFANELQKLNIIERFEMNEEGELFLNHDAYKDEETGEVLDAGMAKINFTSKDPIFVNYMQEAIWPHVKMYSFADTLKFIAVHMYGLTPEQVYGDGKEKESLTEYSYKQLKLIVPGRYFPKTIQNLDDKVIARKFLQYLADTLRALNDDCFVNPVMNQINNEQVPLSIITDVRRVEEVDKIHKMGGKVLYLTRRTEVDTHKIENGFSEITDLRGYFDFVIDNQDMTVAQKNIEIFNELHSVGWL